MVLKEDPFISSFPISLLVFFHYFPSPCVPDVNFWLVFSGLWFPHHRGLEPSVQLPLNLPDISKFFDCLLQLSHLLLEVLHQATPVTVQ